MTDPIEFERNGVTLVLRVEKKPSSGCCWHIPKPRDATPEDLRAAGYESGSATEAERDAALLRVQELEQQLKEHNGRPCVWHQQWVEAQKRASEFELELVTAEQRARNAECDMDLVRERANTLQVEFDKLGDKCDEWQQRAETAESAANRLEAQLRQCGSPVLPHPWTRPSVAPQVQPTPHLDPTLQCRLNGIESRLSELESRVPQPDGK